MSMQDEDIDHLFRSKLEHLEAEPSNKVWNGIVVELDGKKQKSKLMPVIRIAASITVVMAIGLFYLLKDNKTEQYQASNKVMKDDHRANILRTDSQSLIKPAQKTDILKREASLQASKTKKGHMSPDKGNVVLSPLKKINIEQIAASKNIEQVSADQKTLTDTNNNRVAVAVAAVPDQPLNIKSEGPVNESNGFTVPVKVVTAQLPIVKPAVKRHGIRSLGDLINVVVAKVDKRQDKVIEFSDTDEDESTITGINLGIVKIKKDK